MKSFAQSWHRFSYTSSNNAQRHLSIAEDDDLHGERGGTRTHDPMIKSHVLYHLSYALTRRAV